MFSYVFFVFEVFGCFKKVVLSFLSSLRGWMKKVNLGVSSCSSSKCPCQRFYPAEESLGSM